MEDQKLDNLLNLAMDASTEEREKSSSLETGYDKDTGLWEIIVKYSGELQQLLSDNMNAVSLLNGYAVVTLPEEEIPVLSADPRIEYIEMPKRLYFAVNEAKEAACISSVQREVPALTGEGILVGVVDSGVDFYHPDFQNDDGTTRILYYWDQTLESGNPPEGYQRGTQFDNIQLNRILAGEYEGEMPSRDISGHGTQVLGIAAGNGRKSQGRYRGVAWKSDIIAVKLGVAKANSFPRTSELLQGVDYLLRMAVRLQKPIAINISFGNNYGSHKGDSLLETYLDAVSDYGRSCICVGTGNNGTEAVHTSHILETGETQRVQMAIGNFEAGMNLQIWKSYADEMEISLIHPSGTVIGPFLEQLGTQRYKAGRTQLLVYYGKPSPYSQNQEIYVDFIPEDAYIDSGIWKVVLKGVRVRTGEYHMWLPGGGILNPETGFYEPDPDLTQTIPSTASKVISVGAYDSRKDSYADFSGRGSSDRGWNGKPDLTAPGVGIVTTSPPGSYRTVTGTSFAAPFVTGSAALMMEWGIVQGNDPFLYGEKVKAYLKRGAGKVAGSPSYPNRETGYGALCVRDSLPL